MNTFHLFRSLSLIALLGAILLTNIVSSHAQNRSLAQAGVANAIAGVLQNDADISLPVRQRRAAFLKYYIEDQGALLWIGTGRMQAFVELLQRAGFDGLDPRAYPIKSLQKLLQKASSSDAVGLAKIELIYSAFFIRYASDVKIGRFLPGKIDPKLYWHRKKLDVGAALEGLAKAETVYQFFTIWQPQIPEYLSLRKTLGLYYKIAAAGGWSSLPPGELLKPGMSDDRVVVLRKRLSATDSKVRENATGPDETLYTDDLAAAVKAFQVRHGLEPDGAVGKGTLFALNISVLDRLRQIIVSMERWRWMPEKLGDHYIIVNIAGFELRRFRSGRVKEKMRVVVGKSYHQTPVFSNVIKYLEINPYWNVPYSIATKEELPKLKVNPGSFAARGFEAVVGGQAVEVTSIDWSKYSRRNFPVRLRQRPGPRNALGRVKFMFPNRFNIYLHDTPSRSLFARAKRAFSHGCIRVHRPIDLTEQLLKDNQGWDRARIEQVLASKKRTVVNLAKPLPVHLTYSTAWLGEDGAIQFRADVYRRDQKLHRALFGKPSPY